MTALQRYQRLEAPGLWRAAAQDQRRDTIVSLGKATLTISDTRSGEILSHWSLPATTCLNPGEMPALFVPHSGPEASEGESLELDDPEMIEALMAIRRALKPRRNAQRIRLSLAGAGALVLALVGVLWVPGTLTDHAASITPPAKRAQIGRDILAALASGPQPVRACADPAGRQALTSLRSRLLGSGYRLAVLEGAPHLTTAHLPGRLVIIGREFLEGLDSAETLAGHLLAQELLIETTDPMRAFLDRAGVRATVRFLTTGELTEASIAAFGAERLSSVPQSPPAAELVARMAQRGVPLGPYVGSLSDPARQDALTQAQSPAAPAPEPLISDGEWLTLQNICP